MIEESVPPGGRPSAERAVTSDGQLAGVLGKVNLPAIAATIMWAGIYPSVKTIIQDYSPLAVGFIRMSVGAVGLLAILWLVNRRIRWPALADLPLLAAAGFCFAANQVLFPLTLVYLTSSHTVMLYGASPMLTIIAAWLMGQEQPRARVVGGVVISLVGVLLIISQAQGGLSGEWLLGDLIAFAAMLAFVGTTITSMPLLKRMTALEELAFALIFGALFTAPFGLRDALSVDVTRVATSTWMGFAYVLVAGNFGGQLLWNMGVGKYGAAQTVVYFNIQPIFGVLLSVVLLGDLLIPLQLVGSAIVIGGILLARATK